jgi:hypothetical protein
MCVFLGFLFDGKWLTCARIGGVINYYQMKRTGEVLSASDARVLSDETMNAGHPESGLVGCNVCSCARGNGEREVLKCSYNSHVANNTQYKIWIQTFIIEEKGGGLVIAHQDTSWERTGLEYKANAHNLAQPSCVSIPDAQGEDMCVMVFSLGDLNHKSNCGDVSSDACNLHITTLDGESLPNQRFRNRCQGRGTRGTVLATGNRNARNVLHLPYFCTGNKFDIGYEESGDEMSRFIYYPGLLNPNMSHCPVTRRTRWLSSPRQ